MENFTWQNGTKIIFGKDELHRLAKEITTFGGKRVLLTYGGGSIKKIGLYDKIVSYLNEKDIFFVELSGIQPNPRITSVREGVKLIRENNLDFILAVGGGSTLDCSKAIAAGVNYDGDPWDLLTGKGKIPKIVPKLGTVITLAATGSEMNAGGVISNDETEEKLVLHAEQLRPVFTFEDPTLTFTVPKWHTAAGAVDIFSHLLEQYFSSHKDEGINDRLTESMMINVMNYARIAIDNPENYESRANLMWTSTLALNGSLTMGKKRGDWATHGIEHEVSAIYDVTHGAGLAIIQPEVLNYYLEKDLQNDMDIIKFVNLGKNVFNINDGSIEDIAKKTIQKLRDFFNSLDMPNKLSQEKVEESRLEEMAEKCTKNQGFTGWYHEIKKDEVLEILKRAF